MRVTFNAFPDTLLGRLQSLGSEQNKALTQLSTGQRISAPSDDAPAMQRILNLRTEKKQNQQFHRNATDGLERSKVTFSTLEQLKDLLVRSSELAANLSGASSDQEYKAKAAEIDQLIQQGVNLGNTKLRGSYLFSGESTEVLPFQTETDNGKIVRGFKSTYKRHGTLNLFAALEVATGEIKTSKTTLKRREEFLQFMDQIVADAPPDRELHVILDNYCTHKKCEAWLAKNPNVHFHFTPTSASWLNQVEIWFGIMSRKALRGASFKTVEELGQAIDAFIAAYNPTAKPFKWRKREVKGAQLRNTIVNLCN